MDPVEAELPYPPRFRWLTRGIVIGLIALALLVALRIWWGHVAHQRLDVLINDVHARGGKILIRDYQPAPVAEDQNAAVPLRSAFAGIVQVPGESDWLFDAEAALTSKDKQMMGQILRENAKAIELVREAQKRPKVDWGVRLTTPMMSVILNHLNMVRRLAILNEYGVYYEHAQANDAAALRHASDILFLSRSLDAQPAFLISHLVSAGVEAMAARSLVRIAPDLRVEDEATRQQLREIIAQLLDEKRLRQGMRQAWDGEQAAALDNIPFFARQQLSRPVAEVFMPMFILDGVRAARDMEAGANALEQSDFVAAKAVKLPVRSGVNYPMLLTATRLTSGFLATAPTKSMMNRQFTQLAEKRGAAIALAIRLYAIDHQGKLPQNLEELAPKYLPELPTDPFTSGSSFIYLPRHMEPVLYSVGNNGRDDGGTRSAGQSPDIVFPLHPTTRRSE